MEVRGISLTIDPFANETESLELDDLTVENHKDHIAIYGSLEIVKNPRGLEDAMVLKQLFIEIVDKLSKESN